MKRSTFYLALGCTALLSATSARADYLHYWSGDLRAMIFQAGQIEDCQGVEMHGNYNGFLDLNGGILEHHNLEIKAHNFYVCKGMELFSDGNDQNEFIVTGGYIGEDDVIDLEAGQTAIVSINQMPAVFNGTIIERATSLRGEGQNNICHFYGDIPFVSITGAGSNETPPDNSDDFTYGVDGSVDFIDCQFVETLFDPADMCTGGDEAICSAFIQSNNGKLRISNSTFWHYRPLFETPIQITGGLVHIQNTTLIGPGQTFTAGLMDVYGADSTDPDVPSVYMYDCDLSGFYGTHAGVVRIENTEWVLIDDSKFYSNDDLHGAGAMYVDQASLLEIQECDFIDNESVNNTGAVCAATVDVTKISTTEFISNTGGKVGGLQVLGASNSPYDQNGLIISENCVFDDNLSGGEYSTNANAAALRVHDTKDVLVKDSEFVGNETLSDPSYDSNASAISLEYCGINNPSLPSGISNCTFSDNQSTDNTSYAGCIFLESGYNSFSNNTISGNNGYHSLHLQRPSDSGLSVRVDGNRFLDQTIAIFVEAKGGEANYIRNNLFENSSVSALLLILEEGNATDRCLDIDGNTFIDSQAASINILSILDPLQIRNNIFASASPSPEITLVSPTQDYLVHVNHNSFQHGVAEDVDLSGDAVIEDNFWHTPSLCADYQLKHDDILMDAGVATGSGNQEYLDYDFDLTNRNIGWTPPLERVTVSSSMSIDPTTPKEYLVEAHVDLSADVIPAGTTIKVEPLVYVNVTSNTGLEIGDPEGPRTAIVGATFVDDTIYPCEEIIFSAPSVVDGKFYGVLFNYSAQDEDENEDGWLTFRKLNLDLQMQGAGGTNEFSNYDESKLIFEVCSGTFSGVEFGEPQMPAFAALYISDLTMADCEFLELSDSDRDFRLHIIGVASNGGDNRLERCFFYDDDEQDYSNQLKLSNASLQMKDVTFAGYDEMNINQWYSSLRMNDGAECELEINEPSATEPLIEMSGGLLDLFCGYNKFLHEGLDIAQFITWGGVSDQDPELFDWRYNLWAKNCADVITNPEDVEAELDVPWAHVAIVLPDCIFQPLSCDDWLGEAKYLLTAGTDAQGAGHFSVARTYFNEIALLHPKAKQVSEASNRLKSISQKGEYGEVHYEGIRDDQFAGAAVSETVSDHPQAVLQTSNGWLVEAYNGDRPFADDELRAMLAQETDSVCIATIKMARAEILTYPAQGGSSAVDPSHRMEQRIQQDQALRDYLFTPIEGTNVHSEQGSMPSTFAIAKCYPNPFNPVLSIELVLPMEENVRVRAFNLLGQEVAELMNDRTEAGTHILQFDGSNLGSGLYIIQADSESGKFATQKVMLLK